MDYIFWLIIGLVLMAIELVIPGHDCISRGIINLL